MLVEGDGIREEMKAAVHGAIKKVSEDYERMKYNTAIAAMMSLVNDFYAANGVTRDELHTLITMLSPAAPHICEEINERMGCATRLYETPWPQYDENALKAAEVEYGIQVNGKVRGRMALPAGLENAEIEKAVLENAEIKPFIEGKTVKKVIVVKNVVNVVVA